MPAFDYQAAKAKGYSDDQIASYLKEKRASGEDVWIDRKDAPETARQAALIKPLEKAGQYAGDVIGALPGEGLRIGKNVVGGVANLAASLWSTPKAALIHAIPDVTRAVLPKHPVVGQLPNEMPPVEFGPTASTQQLKALGVPNPEIADLITDIPFAGGLNALGKKALLPLGRAVANAEIPFQWGGASGVIRTRNLPAVKQAAEFVSTGASLPDNMRLATQRILRSAEGEADWQSYLRDKRLGEFGKLPTEIQDKIQTAIEKRTVHALGAEEQKTANALLDEYASRISNRTATALRPHELGAHIPALENKAQTARLTFQQRPDRLNRAKLRLAEGRLQRASKGIPADQRVSFTDRPMTKEMRVEEGLKRYGSPQGVPGGLGTGRLARRTANPKLTTQEINAAMEQEGKGRFAPVVQAAQQMGAANDVRVMHGQIVKNLVDKFGIPTANEAESVAGRHLSVATGFDPKYQKILKTKKLPKELDELVGNLNKRLSPGEWNKFAEFNQAMSREFKRWALLSPGFFSRNMQNNVIQTAIFGNVNPKTYSTAFQVRNAMRTGKGLDEVIQVGKAKMKVGDYIESAIKRGVFRGQTGGEIPKTSAYGGVFQKWRGFNAGAEDISRSAFDLYNQGKGLDAVKSGERVDEVLFNYSSRTGSRLKGHARKYYYPFINWDSQIGPLFVRTALERPGSLGMTGKLTTLQNQRMGFNQQDVANLGGDVEKGGGIVTRATPDSATAQIPQGFGTYSVNELIPNFKERGALAVTDQLASRSYPWLSVPYSLGTKRDLMTEKSWEGKEIPQPTTAPSGLKLLFFTTEGKDYAKKHGIFVDKEGTVKAPADEAIFWRSIPHQRLVSLIVDRFSQSRGSDVRLQSFSTGFRSVTRERGVGEKIGRSKEHREKKERHYNLRAYPDTLREEIAR